MPQHPSPNTDTCMMALCHCAIGSLSRQGLFCQHCSGQALLHRLSLFVESRIFMTYFGATMSSSLVKRNIILLSSWFRGLDHVQTLPEQWTQMTTHQVMFQGSPHPSCTEAGRRVHGRPNGTEGLNLALHLPIPYQRMSGHGTVNTMTLVQWMSSSP